MRTLICTAHLADGPLVCTRTDPHDRGHVFVSTSGVPDRHDRPGGGDGE